MRSPAAIVLERMKLLNVLDMDHEATAAMFEFCTPAEKEVFIAAHKAVARRGLACTFRIIEELESRVREEN